MFFYQVCYQHTVTLVGAIVGKCGRKVWKESTMNFNLFEKNLWNQSMKWRRENCLRTGERFPQDFCTTQEWKSNCKSPVFHWPFLRRKENSTTEVSGTGPYHLLLISSASLKSDYLSQRSIRQSNITLLSHGFCPMNFLWIPYIASRRKGKKKKSSKAAR